MSIFILSALMITSAVGVSGHPAPPGLRFPVAADIKGDWLEFRKTYPKPWFAQADLNSDGKMDEAWILLKEKGAAWTLFVFLSQPDGSFESIKLTEGSDRVQNQGVSVAKPGKYSTACAKGYGSPCADGEMESIELTKGAFTFFTFESSTSVIYWDSSRKTLKQVWTSD